VKKTLVNVNLHCQSLINSKTKPNKSIPNINEHNKMNSVFFRIFLCHVLVVCCSMMARCTVEPMICDYHEYISKLLLESELDLLKYCNIKILTLILMQNKLKRSSHCCMPKLPISKKLANCCDSPKFFPLQRFLLYSISNNIFLLSII